jgi:hypothetical protein
VKSVILGLVLADRVWSTGRVQRIRPSAILGSQLRPVDCWREAHAITDYGAPIAIDLTEADQSEYHALEQGEGITVGGVVKPPENADARLMPFLAFWIQRDRQ